jgi:hypothetical protein
MVGSLLWMCATAFENLMIAGIAFSLLREPSAIDSVALAMFDNLCSRYFPPYIAIETSTL